MINLWNKQRILSYSLKSKSRMVIIKGNNLKLGSTNKKIKKFQYYSKILKISNKNLLHHKSKSQVLIKLLILKGQKKLQLKKTVRRTKIKKKGIILKNSQMLIKLMKIIWNRLIGKIKNLPMFQNWAKVMLANKIFKFFKNNYRDIS